MIHDGGGEGNKPKVTARHRAELRDLTARHPSHHPYNLDSLRPSPAGYAHLGVEEEGLLGPALMDFFFQEEDLLGFPHDPKTYVSLGNWRAMAEEMLQPAHEAGPRGSCCSPRLSLWAPFHLISGTAKVERSRPSRCPSTAHVQLFGTV